ncbi:Tetratricopeptide repeat-containing protein [Fodinibius salinus]|uniref:Tetratricopeptide repeat-containing protein n=1 Tax=Fodinibius salinus TaxID=860790 RepID=A0A5D3YMJ0_9BACT|nr:tetratricopeptide repeat protein [Fodinibius salinus]TYP94982.1 Tetratricopeptide repeat-containing protein [Fodinibius salinus]
MNLRPFTTYLIIGFVALSIPLSAAAQTGNAYSKAEQLLNQQEYQQAYKIFYRLHQEKPSVYTYLQKATECLIQLKDYEKAITITQEANESPRVLIRLGEIYHISGDRKQAFAIWNELQQQTDRQQTLLRLANTMSDRQEHQKAIAVYQKIRREFSASSSISAQLADTYLQAGEYSKAINEYLQLVKSNNRSVSYVQRQLLRFRDNQVYDVAILEISDFLDDLSPAHPQSINLQQLEVWLLMERKLYQRALVTAQNVESQSDQTTYILYNLADRLLAANEFTLAERAYSYYIENNNSSLKYQCMEELASVYRRWASYLENYNLSLSPKKDELYQKAREKLLQIRQQNPNYRQLNEVLIALSEMALDVFHQPKEASKYLKELRKQSSKKVQAQIYFIKGRLHLYNNEHTRARIAFTQSTKETETGALAEKSRYYTALADFYSGDYEFAKIQLNALERQHTSYFANDAVQLRMWIQDGLQADSTGQQLAPLAKAVEYFSQGKDQLGKNKLQEVFHTETPNPLADNALLIWSKHKNGNNVTAIYKELTSYLKQRGAASPLHERLLWEKARIADQFVNTESISPEVPKNDSSQLPQSVDAVINIYEDIILNYPDGFYASFVRQRINELQNIQT